MALVFLFLCAWYFEVLFSLIWLCDHFYMYVVLCYNTQMSVTRPSWPWYSCFCVPGTLKYCLVLSGYVIISTCMSFSAIILRCAL